MIKLCNKLKTLSGWAIRNRIILLSLLIITATLFISCDPEPYKSLEAVTFTLADTDIKDDETISIIENGNVIAQLTNSDAGRSQTVELTEGIHSFTIDSDSKRYEFTTADNTIDIKRHESQSITIDATIKAYYVTFNTKFDESIVNPVEAILVVKGETIADIKPKLKDGYDQAWEFTGWKDASGKEYDSNTPITSDITLFAEWASKWDGSSDTASIELQIANNNKQIVINTAAEFAGFAEIAKSGETFDSHTIVLDNDISLNGHKWTSINLFEGSFDGAGHTISGIDNAIFEKVQNANIRNLTVSGTIDCSNSIIPGIGGISTYAEYTLPGTYEISNIQTDVDITGCHIGGVFSNLNVSTDVTLNISNIINTGAIQATIIIAQSSYTGSIIGKADILGNVNIKNIINEGDITLGKCQDGCIGSLFGRINNLYLLDIDHAINNGEIKYLVDGESDDIKLGGLIGRIAGEDSSSTTIIRNSSNSRTIKAASSYGKAGGIIGSAVSTNLNIENSENTGEIICDWYSGGIIGELNNYSEKMIAVKLTDVKTSSGEIWGNDEDVQQAISEGKISII